MLVNKNTLSKHIFYLKKLETVINIENISIPLYKDGTTIGQVIFHSSEAINYWIRVVILKQKYFRHREREFKDEHFLEEISKSVKSALNAYEELILGNIDLEQPIEQTKSSNSENLAINYVYEVLIHLASHTAEHFGEIHIKIQP